MTNWTPQVYGKNGGSDAESDDIGERIHLAAESAHRVRHAGDAAVQAVQHHGCADGLGRHLEVRIGAELPGGREERTFDRAAGSR